LFDLPPGKGGAGSPGSFRTCAAAAVLVVFQPFQMAPFTAPPADSTFSRAVGNIEYDSGPLSPMPPRGVTGVTAVGAVDPRAKATAWYGRIMRRLPTDLASMATGHFVAFVAEYRDGVAANARCDMNANGDLSDDPELQLYSYPGDPRTRSFLVDLGKLPREGGRERLHRIVLEPSSEQPRFRAQLVHAMVGTVTLDGMPHFAFLHDGNGDGMYTRDLADGLFVDLDDDGRIVVDQMSEEFGPFSVPFTMGAASYEVAAVDPEGRTLSLRHLGPGRALPAAPAIGQPVPDFEVPDTSGVTRRISDFRGQYALLYFWSSTCGTCVAQAEDLVHLHERFRAARLEILGISYDTDRQAMEAFRAKHHQTWPTSFSGRQLWEDPVGRIYRERGSGILYLVDPKGILQGTYSSLADLSAMLETLIPSGGAT